MKFDGTQAMSSLGTSISEDSPATVDALQQYLSHAFHTDRQDAAAIEGLIIEAARTLVAAFTNRGWPYKVEQGSELAAPASPSHSTTAMIALALNRLLGAAKPRLNERYALRFPFDALDRELESDLRIVAMKALEVLFGSGGILEGGVVTTKSKTYGTDDVLTLSYLLDLAGADGNGSHEKALRDYALSQHNRLANIDPKKSYRKYFTFPPDQESPGDPTSNAFIPLRAIQAIRQAETLLAFPEQQIPDLSQYRLFFEDTLHNQLSYSAIPDSRFDPAELAFCLEGFLLAQREAVDHSIMSRVMEVLTQAQTENAYWRPTRPFLSDERGMVLFPVSVEVANSLMRSCELFDEKRLYDTFVSASIGLFRRYSIWLRARTVRFHTKVKTNGSNTRTAFVGWHSEHVNEPGLLHTWETS